jgi:phosphate transport system permease protein
MGSTPAGKGSATPITPNKPSLPFGRAVSSRRARSRIGDPLFKWATGSFAVLIAGLAVLIMVSMALNSRLPFDKFGVGFLGRSIWDPVKGEFGAFPFIYGTAVSAVIALLISVPISLGVAIFLVEKAPRRVSNPILFIVQLLAAIPSVVFGLWGMFVLAPMLRTHVYPALQSSLGFLPLFGPNQNGLGLLTAGLILSIMVLPIITAVTTDVLRAVPGTQREASLALGSTKWEATLIVLQNAKSGISGAMILGLGRAIGETMAVTMVIGNRPQISASLFDPSYSIASVIANEFTEATTELYLQSLIELGLILFFVTFIINMLARLLVWSVTRGEGRGAHV